MGSIIIAILVFLSIYLVWYSFRFFADFCLVGIALGAAVLAYQIPNWYPIFHMIWEESSFLNIFSLDLPPDQPDIGATILIAILIIASAVLASIPFLPFSATYRMMLGIEGPLFKNQVRVWINEEVQRHQQPQEVQDSHSVDKNKPRLLKQLASSLTDFWARIRKDRFQ